MAGATIVFSIPVGVLVSSLFIAISKPYIREIISTDSAATYQLMLSYMQIFKNIIPLIIICVAIAIGLLLKPDSTIKGFIIFGKTMDSVDQIRALEVSGALCGDLST